MSGPQPREKSDSLDAALERRAPLLRDGGLDALRLVNGAGDGLPGLSVDRFGDVLLATSDEGADFEPFAKRLVARLAPRALFHKVEAKSELEPRLVHSIGPGSESGEVVVREQGRRFLVRARERNAAGLFLDQRDNRSRVAELVAKRVAEAGGCSLLNTFAYTCSFSVAAALAGARTASVDLSARFLDWGRANFEQNGLDPSAHEFARGDALVFLEIAAKKGRKFDLLVLDPPTFSTSKQRGVFQVERHFGRLFELAARVAAPRARLLCSHNRRTFTDAALAESLREGARAAGRRIVALEAFAPPPDFPGSPATNPAARGGWVELD
jgi:23S rRNA (cytosine1962-C5)-methyltransferase